MLMAEKHHMYSQSKIRTEVTYAQDWDAMRPWLAHTHI